MIKTEKYGRADDGGEAAKPARAASGVEKKSAEEHPADHDLRDRDHEHLRVGVDDHDWIAGGSALPEVHRRPEDDAARDPWNRGQPAAEADGCFSPERAGDGNDT